MQAVQRLLDHLARRMKSWSTRDRYLEILQGFVRFAGASPDRLVSLTSDEASEVVQGYIDRLTRAGGGLRTVNLCADTIVTFFRVNGYKKGKELDIEKHHVPARYRKTEEYVPSREEAWRMAERYRTTTKIKKLRLAGAAFFFSSTTRFLVIWPYQSNEQRLVGVRTLSKCLVNL